MSAMEEVARMIRVFSELLTKMRHSSAQGVLFSQAIAERLGLNPTDVECLEILTTSGPVTAGELAELTGLTSGSVTTLIDRLEKAGYVRRERDQHDRRRVIVHPSPRMAEIRPLYAGIQQAMAQVCAGYNPAQLAVIAHFLDQSQAALAAETARLRGGGEASQVTARARRSKQAVMEGPTGVWAGARLDFGVSAKGLNIRADKGLTVLYRVHFAGVAPKLQTQVEAERATVSISVGDEGRANEGGTVQGGELLLSAATPWSLRFTQQLKQIDADLSGLRLQELSCAAGVDNLSIKLPPPEGKVKLTFSGEVTALTIQYAAQTAVRLEAREEASQLRLDGHILAASSGGFSWETPNYAAAELRYDIELEGAAHEVTIRS